jgi:hypothetical protein
MGSSPVSKESCRLSIGIWILKSIQGPTKVYRIDNNNTWAGGIYSTILNDWTISEINCENRKKCDNLRICSAISEWTKSRGVLNGIIYLKANHTAQWRIFVIVVWTYENYSKKIFLVSLNKHNFLFVSYSYSLSYRLFTFTSLLPKCIFLFQSRLLNRNTQTFSVALSHINAYFLYSKEQMLFLNT